MLRKSSSFKSWGAMAALLAGLTACGSGGDNIQVGEAAASPPVTIVDSILPIEEAVRRFAIAAGPPPSALNSEWTSVEELGRAFLDALSGGDTAFLADAMVTPVEYITFYFPHSVYMAPPYEMDPAIIWFQMTSASDRGLTRALDRFGGRDLEWMGHTCAEPVDQGPNRIRESCRVRLRRDGEELELRLFGPVLERAGNVKFLTYGNDL